MLTRDQAVAKVALGCVTVVTWTYLLVGAGMDTDHAGMSVTEPMAMAWSVGVATAVFAMWAVMHMLGEDFHLKKFLTSLPCELFTNLLHTTKNLLLGKFIL